MRSQTSLAVGSTPAVNRLNHHARTTIRAAAVRIRRQAPKLKFRAHLLAHRRNRGAVDEQIFDGCSARHLLPLVAGRLLSTGLGGAGYDRVAPGRGLLIGHRAIDDHLARNLRTVGLGTNRVHLVGGLIGECL